MANILVADDDAHIREVVVYALEQAGHSCTQAKDGLQALTIIQKSAFDLVVLDVMMPEMDGTEVCRHIRKTSSCPIIFVSARDDEVDRVLGLELGGDDYVTKPFSPRELVARVKAVLRRDTEVKRHMDMDQEPESMEHGRLNLDLNQHRAFWDREELQLTLTEFGILRTLMGTPGKVYSREDLMKNAYELARTVSDRTIDSHVRRVRRKFLDMGCDPIQTMHGLGYKLGAC